MEIKIEDNYKSYFINFIKKLIEGKMQPKQEAIQMKQGFVRIDGNCVLL